MRLSVVCYLDLVSTDAIRTIQQELASLTGAKASLELWRPHITVGDGVEVDEQELNDFVHQLEELSNARHSFQLQLRDILKLQTRVGGEGEETTPYGLYLEVKQTDDLISLVEGVAKASHNLYKWYQMPQPYHPHCSLAFKDLSKEGFKKGSVLLDERDINITVTINHIALVEMLPDETRELTRVNLI